MFGELITRLGVINIKLKSTQFGSSKNLLKHEYRIKVCKLGNKT